MIETEIRASEKAEARMKDADAREDRSTAKQQVDHSHSRKKIEALQTLVKSLGGGLLHADQNAPLQPFDANDVLGATSKVD